MKPTALIIAGILTLTSVLHADPKFIDVGNLIKRVIAGENFAGQELVITGYVLSGGTSASGLINLGTYETYRSGIYQNYVSVYDSTAYLQEGTSATIRVQVEESSNSKINGKNFVIIETAFRQCLSCKK